MVEISWRLDRIVNRRNQNLEVEAKLHGMEIKTPKPAKEPEKLDDDKQKAMDEALEAAIKRKAKEYGRG